MCPTTLSLASHIEIRQRDLRDEMYGRSKGRADTGSLYEPSVEYEVTLSCLSSLKVYLFYSCYCLSAGNSGMNRLRPREKWGRDFESHSRHGCLCAFILFVLFCV
jgi:hypothetical protein